MSIDAAGWSLENSYAHLPEMFYSKLSPTPVRSPKLLTLNDRLAVLLGFNPEALRSDESISILAGNKTPAGVETIAQAYAGHQFGHFTMLGDGRAILLGEQVTPLGERYDVQLKGSGRTPYSRRGDGRAALGPMLREYIISEAMYALGIPTTRSLAVVATGESVRRETIQPGAVLTRVAASHIRVGTFEYVAQWGSNEDLRLLADYTIRRHYMTPNSDLDEANRDGTRYLFLLKEVVKRQASLIAKWQMVGFIHGVMNTDNMALSGETIDYGPCAFMDVYDPATVFSSIDVNGRYAYGNQPRMAQWNLARFAETLLPLLHEDHEQAVQLAQEAITEFAELYQHEWLSGMRAKLGIFGEEDSDYALAEEILGLMHKHRADFTNTFRALTNSELDDIPLFTTDEFKHWYAKWHERLNRQEQGSELSKQLMARTNPAVIPRNHKVEEALKAAVEQDDYDVMERLIEVLSHPYAETPEFAEYAMPGPEGTCYRTFCGT